MTNDRVHTTNAACLFLSIDLTAHSLFHRSVTCHARSCSCCQSHYQRGCLLGLLTCCTCWKSNGKISGDLPMLFTACRGVFSTRLRCEFLVPSHQWVAHKMWRQESLKARCHVLHQYLKSLWQLVFFGIRTSPIVSPVSHGHCQQASIGPSDASLGSSVWSNGCRSLTL